VIKAIPIARNVDDFEMWVKQPSIMFHAILKDCFFFNQTFTIELTKLYNGISVSTCGVHCWLTKGTSNLFKLATITCERDCESEEAMMFPGEKTPLMVAHVDLT